VTAKKDKTVTVLSVVTNPLGRAGAMKEVVVDDYVQRLLDRDVLRVVDLHSQDGHVDENQLELDDSGDDG
jgi:hypothetical protein